MQASTFAYATSPRHHMVNGRYGKRTKDPHAKYIARRDGMLSSLVVFLLQREENSVKRLESLSV